MSSSLFKASEIHHKRSAQDLNPFSDKPSGSQWKKSQLEWLNISFKWDCNAEFMFTVNSQLRQSGFLCTHLKENLGLSWEEITTQTHRTGSVYQTLATLASHLPPLPPYQDDEAHLSSSPRSSHSSEAQMTSYNPKGSQAVFSAPARSAESPLRSKSGHLVGLPSGPSTHQHETPPQLDFPESSDRQPARQAALPRLDYANKLSIGESSVSSGDSVEEEQSAPSPKLPMKGVDGWHPDKSLEKDVELAASAFLYLIQDSFLATEINLSEAKKKEQDLKMEVR